MMGGGVDMSSKAEKTDGRGLVSAPYISLDSHGGGCF
jgi:hypothetical protein